MCWGKKTNNNFIKTLVYFKKWNYLLRFGNSFFTLFWFPWIKFQKADKCLMGISEALLLSSFRV